MGNGSGDSEALGQLVVSLIVKILPSGVSRAQSRGECVCVSA